MIKSFFLGNWLVFTFYIEFFSKLLTLDRNLLGWDKINENLKAYGRFEFSFPIAMSREYNQAIRTLGEKLRKLENERAETFTFRMIFFFVIRSICVVTAYYGSLYLTVLISLLQFVALPYSFFVAFAKIIELFPPLFMSSMLVFPILQYIKSFVAPQFYYTITINNNFIICFFLIDQILCLICTFITPRGKTVQMTTERILKSVFFGFINTKSYFLVLLFLLRGVNLSLFVWIFDAILNISGRISQFMNGKIPCWEILFYHQHRIAHLPYVFQDAHKFHHYLSDTTSFDAHIYGSGAPEEWHCLMLELLPSFFFGTVPPSLTYHVLKISWSNKVAHTRNVDGNNGENQHADHHLYHVKNYCWFPPLEMYMQTCTNNNIFTAYGYKISKRIEDNKAVFSFAKSGATENKAVFNFIKSEKELKIT